MDLDYCIEKGHVKKIPPDRECAEKEWLEAVKDLEDARDALKRGKAKWAIVSGLHLFS